MTPKPIDENKNTGDVTFLVSSVDPKKDASDEEAKKKEESQKQEEKKLGFWARWFGKGKKVVSKVAEVVTNAGEKLTTFAGKVTAVVDNILTGIGLDEEWAKDARQSGNTFAQGASFVRRFVSRANQGLQKVSNTLKEAGKGIKEWRDKQSENLESITSNLTKQASEWAGKAQNVMDVLGDPKTSFDQIKETFKNINIDPEDLVKKLQKQLPNFPIDAEKLAKDAEEFARKNIEPARIGDSVGVMLKNLEPKTAMAAAKEILNSAKDNYTGFVVKGKSPKNIINCLVAQQDKDFVAKLQRVVLEDPTKGAQKILTDEELTKFKEKVLKGIEEAKEALKGIEEAKNKIDEAKNQVVNNQVLTPMRDAEQAMDDAKEQAVKTATASKGNSPDLKKK